MNKKRRVTFFKVFMTVFALIIVLSPVDTAGTNTHNGFTVDLAIGNATGGKNNVRGLQVDSITSDAQITETAINVGTGQDILDLGNSTWRAWFSQDSITPAEAAMIGLSIQGYEDYNKEGKE